MANEGNLKPFKKGDTRINRNGRPKSFDQLRKLAQQILAEEATKDGEPVVINGHIVTKSELILRSWVADKRFQERLLEVAYGKVPTPVEHSGQDGQPIQVIIQYADDNA